MKTYSVNGYYGSGKTPCIVFVYETPKGCWYVADGGETVNLTWHYEIEDGVNIESLPDIDCFTVSSPINSIDDLIEAVEG